MLFFVWGEALFCFGRRVFGRMGEEGGVFCLSEEEWVRRSVAWVEECFCFFCVFFFEEVCLFDSPCVF